MKIKRDVWAEFGDGSVAVYGVKDDELQALLTQLCGVGMPCAIWVDGRLWTKHGQSEYDDGLGGGDGRSAPSAPSRGCKGSGQSEPDTP